MRSHRLPVHIVAFLVASLAAFGTASAQQPQHLRVAGTSPPASSADCEPGWLPTFGHLPGVDGGVGAMTTFDDGLGGGPLLYVGGSFLTAGGLPDTMGLARWDGSSWSSVGGGLDGWVGALTVFDDGQGGGPALYAAGNFSLAGGVAANDIAKWDGTSWSPLGDGITDSGGVSYVRALAVFDDGGGPALFAGGTYPFAGGLFVRSIAKWDGAAWSGLGSGVGSPAPEAVSALAVFDDGQGGGPALYMGGSFNVVDGLPKNHLAKWDGASWSGVGGGANDEVRCLSVIDLGGGPALYVGGEFSTAGGSTMNRIAAWDGTNWRSLDGGVGNAGSGAQPWVSTIGAYDDGNGLGLYAGGRFVEAGGVVVHDIARWNGSSWSALDDGIDDVAVINEVMCLAVFDDGGGAGPRLHVGGSFLQASQVPANHLAAWDGSDWTGVGAGAETGPDNTVYALTLFDDGRGGGPALYVGGSFTSAGGVPAQHVAKWDGASWSALGDGLSDSVYALAVFDDGMGGGPSLYAGGQFRFTGVPTDLVTYIARWTGTAWVPVGGGMNQQVECLAIFDDGLGGGPALYAGGEFTSAGGASGTQLLAKWDGVAWSSVSGSGVTGGWFIQGNLFSWVGTLEVYDDGSGGGPALFAGGLFTSAGGVPASRIAKWDGTSWSALGSGVVDGFTWIDDLQAFDDGSGAGPALYAAGRFTSIGGVPASYVARWNGSSWSPFGGGISAGIASELALFDDGGGSGPALIVGGEFTAAGGVPANSVARWDGLDWAPLGEGVNKSVFALVVVDQGRGAGPELIAGGTFTGAGGAGDGYIARWGGCPVEPSPWTFVGYALSGVDGPPLLAGTGSLLAGAPGTLALTHAAPSALSMLFVSLTGVSAPFKCGTLVPVPVNLQVLLFTNGAGSLPLGWVQWPGGLSGLNLFFQYAVQDGAAACGVSLSNALRADVP